ncbi:MAG: aminotransferase class I/II-fold pyridoxal phosphate-dependent enzyme [Candidatus Caldarchaeum sp.]
MGAYFAHPTALVESQQIGDGTRIWAFVHILKGAIIGRNCNIGDHCYIEDGVVIGDEVVIKNGVSIWTGVTIENRVFIGPNAAFTNDRVPRAKAFRSIYDRTVIQEGATIGANATLVCPLTVGRYALVGAGAVVTRDVPAFGLVYGNPARLEGFVCRCGQRLPFALDNNGYATCRACGCHYEKQGLEVKETTTQTPIALKPVHIPLVDLRPQYEELRLEIDTAIREVIESSVFSGGELVEAFEKEWANFCGTRYAVACASGTDALRLALMVAGVHPGSEVITVPHTFIATVEAITMVGAHPVFVDIDEDTYTLSPERLLEFLETECRLDDFGRTVNTKTSRPVIAILPVHLYGLPANISPILELADRYGLIVIEDACQAHGATYRLRNAEKRAGALGHIAAFSFYPSKNLGAMGEGGIVTTDDPERASQARLLRNHGQRERYVHISPLGWNSRLDTLQCAILSVKLKKLEEWNARRRQIAQWYRERLADLNIPLPVEPPYANHVYHLYVVRVRERDRISAALAEQGIATGLHYPIPLHLQKAYSHLGYQKGAFPVSEAVAQEVLSLPMYPHLTEEQVDIVCRHLRRALGYR